MNYTSACAHVQQLQEYSEIFTLLENENDKSNA